MKSKNFNATKLFSKQFETIFGKETTFGDISKVTSTTLAVNNVRKKFEKVQKNSNVNFLGSHVESFVKEKTNANTTKTKEKL